MLNLLQADVLIPGPGASLTRHTLLPVSEDIRHICDMLVLDDGCSFEPEVELIAECGICADLRVQCLVSQTVNLLLQWIHGCHFEVVFNSRLMISMLLSWSLSFRW